MAEYIPSDIDKLWQDTPDVEAPKKSRGHKLKGPKKNRYVDYDRGHKLKESRKKGTKLGSRKYYNNDYKEGE